MWERTLNSLRFDLQNNPHKIYESIKIPGEKTSIPKLNAFQMYAEGRLVQRRVKNFTFFGIIGPQRKNIINFGVHV